VHEGVSGEELGGDARREEGRVERRVVGVVARSRELARRARFLLASRAILGVKSELAVIFCFTLLYKLVPRLNNLGSCQECLLPESARFHGTRPALRSAGRD